jgi:hypothetical protein
MIPSSPKVSSPCPGEQPVDGILDGLDLETETDGAASSPRGRESDFFKVIMVGWTRA